MTALVVLFLALIASSIVSGTNSWRRFFYGCFVCCLNTFFWICIGVFLEIGVSSPTKAMQLFCICVFLNIVLFNAGFFFFSKLYEKGTDRK